MSHRYRQFKGGLKSASRNASKVIRRSANELEKGFDRLRDRRICLGVTGFSGSGKSTFLTSVVHQLMHFPQATLPAFSPVLRDQILGVTLHDTGYEIVEGFDYHAGIDALSASPPRWPQSTKGLSSTVLEIRYKPRGRLIQIPGRHYSKLFVEIRDYPGEWLLDLPLLELGYLDWCRECTSQFSAGPRKELLGYYQQLVSEIDPFSSFNEEKARQISAEYIGFMQRCRGAGLSFIQPGRFLHLDESGSAGAAFFPLLNLSDVDDGQIKQAPENSFYKTLERHFIDYRDNQVKSFYQQAFAGIDRQVILVDLLGALSSGQAGFEDTRASLSRVLDSFEYGQNSILSKLFKPRIEKVIFAASKVDQVLPEQHENTRMLMAALVYDAYRLARYKQVDSYCEAIASVRATSIRNHNDTSHLVGIDQSGVAGLMTHPDIPNRMLSDEEWKDLSDWKLRPLAPPAGLHLKQGEGLPHIRIDTVMRELLGDKFV